MEQIRNQIIAAMGLRLPMTWDCPNPRPNYDYNIDRIEVLDSKTATISYNSKNKSVTEVIPLEQILILPLEPTADVKVGPGKYDKFLMKFIPIFVLTSFLCVIVYCLTVSTQHIVFTPVLFLYTIFCIKFLMEMKKYR